MMRIIEPLRVATFSFWVRATILINGHTPKPEEIHSALSNGCCLHKILSDAHCLSVTL